MVSNVSRAVPTLALLTLFAVSAIGFGDRATTIALAVFAIPPILTNTYVGFRGVDADVAGGRPRHGPEPRPGHRPGGPAAGAALVMTGLRTAAVQVVATAGLAALVGGGGLGRIVNLGFGQQNYGVMIAGAVLVAALALLTELMLVARGPAVVDAGAAAADPPVPVPGADRPACPEPTAAGMPLVSRSRR